MVLRLTRRKIMFGILRPTLALTVLLPLTSCGYSTAPADSPPLSIILMIGDGMGPGAIEAARMGLGVSSLSMEELAIRGTVTTASATHDITDSGAAATALATGHSTYNRAIGVDTSGAPVQTVLELAESRGMSTGLVATSSVTHATPAAFAAHVADRREEFLIAEQMSASGVDVLLGGGHTYFGAGSRSDGRDLIGAFIDRGCAVVLSEAEFPSAAVPESCLLGLLTGGGMPEAERRTVGLDAMATRALEVLDTDADGFFLMIEGSQIDWAGHANDGDWLIEEMRDFDRAVEAVRQFVAGRPNTLLIVTADHETGGLSVTAGPNGDPVFSWETTGHTSALVPLFASGPFADALTGTHHLAQVGRYLKALLAD